MELLPKYWMLSDLNMHQHFYTFHACIPGQHLLEDL